MFHDFFCVLDSKPYLGQETDIPSVLELGPLSPKETLHPRSHLNYGLCLVPMNLLF